MSEAKTIRKSYWAWEFDLFSDLDSRIAHLNKIGKALGCPFRDGDRDLLWHSSQNY